jgi:hypothetical protein
MIKNMKAKRDNSGIVFDVYEDKVERFISVTEYLKERDGHCDFEVIKCLSLPELEDEPDSQNSNGGGAWRANGGGGGGDYNSKYNKY